VTLEKDFMARTASTGRGGIHVAIIMDGNGRWAVARGLPRTAGHRAGATAVRRPCPSCVRGTKQVSGVIGFCFISGFIPVPL
jgi:undecaprenyl diphosphate synthase